MQQTERIGPTGHSHNHGRTWTNHLVCG
jgi:hypothetical protein